jgi:hypothetical protein
VRNTFCVEARDGECQGRQEERGGGRKKERKEAHLDETLTVGKGESSEAVL